MPGEFYIEGKKEKVDISQILDNQSELKAKSDAIRSQTDKLAGLSPVSGSVAQDWIAESNVVLIGNVGTRHKVHSLLISIHNLVGTAVTVRLYLPINGVERKVYEQVFDATSDPPGLWIINGTVGICNALRVTLQSNNADDSGKVIDYDYMLEAM